MSIPSVAEYHPPVEVKPAPDPAIEEKNPITRIYERCIQNGGSKQACSLRIADLLAELKEFD